MTPIYIAAPYRPVAQMSILDNVWRAERLAAVARSHGHAPVCIHRAILAGMYGDDNDPTERDRGVALACAIAEAIGKAGGELWILLTPTGQISAGCAREASAFASVCEGRVRMWAMTTDGRIEER